MTNNYDFKSLNDKEFETLSIQLIGLAERQKFERFKPGRDAGVDGRYFSPSGSEIILQCKHWANTPTRELIAKLRSVERPKIEKLKPERYLLAVSNNLSRNDKKVIKNSLSPYIVSESDIYGNEDLNDLLGTNPDVERQHYKLWLHSASVLTHVLNAGILGRSDYSIAEIHQRSAKYVVTTNHEQAKEQLEKLGVVIITGEPGIGKTTLAEHLCLHYVAERYQFVHITEGIKEAEGVLTADTRQLLYFDDFLGRNYLEAISGREGTSIANFIRRIAANKNKRFILTSRSNILNQGKVLIDTLENNNIKKNEYELKISSLSELDKARILYNHIWFSGLGNSYVDVLYEERRYKQVIRHKNFNPRLISFVTDATRLEGIPSQGYWQFVLNALSNPKEIWEHAFISQHDDYCRIIVLLVVLNRHRISEEQLSAAYDRYLASSQPNFEGRKDFYSNARILTGTFLNRFVDEKGQAFYNLFNPSVGDYVLARHRKDLDIIKRCLVSLRNAASLITIESLEKEKHLTTDTASAIRVASFKSAYSDNFDGVDVTYLAWLLKLIFEKEDSAKVAMLVGVEDAIRVVLEDESETPGEDAFAVVSYGLNGGLVTHQEALNFVANNVSVLSADEEIAAATSLLSEVSEETDRWEVTWVDLRAQVVAIASSDIDEFVNLDDAFSDLDSDNYSMAAESAQGLIADKLRELGFEDVESDADEIVEACDLYASFSKFFRNAREDEGFTSHSRGNAEVQYDQEIDDLFQRD